MLQSLSIRDFVLIEKLDLTFARDATGGPDASKLGALTGETGAGKSILIDALGLVLGARAESGVVRRGAAQASIAASFDLSREHAAHAILAEQGLDDEDVLTLRRAIGADGRGRAFVNDQPASVALLRRLGDTLVEIQGQMDQHGLLDMATHRGSLDAFAGLEKQGATVRAAWAVWRAAEQARSDAEAAAAAARRDEEFLRHAVKELEALAPRADDEETLAAERQLLRAGTALGEAVTQALGELEHGKGAVHALSTAHRLIERNADKAAGHLDASLAALDRALSEATEAQAQLETAREALEFDPARLEKIEERLKSSPFQDGRSPEPVQLLELGSGISDVTAMVWQLMCDRLRSAGHDNPMGLFTITNCEYEVNTGAVASDLLAKTGKTNVRVRYGPEIGDATRLVGLKDSIFDIVWSSLFLGAFPLVGDGRIVDIDL